MEYLLKHEINTAIPLTMHIDMNSCFASIEQQHHPEWRHKPIAVAPYITPYGTIISPSIEAKKLGIKTGTKIIEAQKICPQIIITTPDISKYTKAHHKLREILETYSPDVVPRSIDEFVVDFKNMAAGVGLKDHTKTANEIKEKIKSGLGEYIQVSIGYGTNRFLAKTAAGLIKPNGLVIISHENYHDTMNKLKLTDLCGISFGNSSRLNSVGIFDLKGFYTANFDTLKSAFGESGAFSWYMKLRGWEVDDYETNRGSFSHSYVLKEFIYNIEDAKPIIHKLCVKLSERLRKANCSFKGVYVGVRCTDKYKYGNQIHYDKKDMFSTDELYKTVLKLLRDYKSVAKIKLIDIGCFDLVDQDNMQLDFFTDRKKDEKYWQTIDEINNKWGRYTFIPSHMVSAKKAAPDSIAFGKAVMGET